MLVVLTQYYMLSPSVVEWIRIMNHVRSILNFLLSMCRIIVPAGSLVIPVSSGVSQLSTSYCPSKIYRNH